MAISHFRDIPEILIEGNGAKGISKRSVLGPKEGWPDYVMRYFEINEGGHTPRHTHPWPHYVFVVSGKGVAHLEGLNTPIEQGSVIMIPENAIHQFSSDEKHKLCFTCIVPPEGDA